MKSSPADFFPHILITTLVENARIDIVRWKPLMLDHFLKFPCYILVMQHPLVVYHGICRKWDISWYTYHERGLHKDFIPCHRKYSGQHYRYAIREVHDGKIGWMQYRPIDNGCPVFWLAVFSMELNGINNIPTLLQRSCNPDSVSWV